MRCLAIIACTCILMHASPSPSTAQPTDRPRLTVVLVIDQFRADFITRYQDLYVEGGLARLIREGAWFKDTTYGHAHTSTSPGHSVITSGTYGYRSGIIANSWYDRQTRRQHLSLTDPNHRILGKPRNPNGRSSPNDIHGSTLSDELRKSTNFQGKYFATSVKDYSAMVSAGKMGIPLWYEASLGRFTSSDFYMDDLPEWVNVFNDRKLPESYFGKQWNRLLPVSVYEERVGADDRPNEENNRSAGITFPHTITGGESEPGVAFWNSLKHTPWGDEVILEFARTLIREEQLGSDETPDILVVSLGSVDYVGHDYGPFSHESLDSILRVDRQIAGFIDFLDQEIGLDQMLLVLTSDHGAVPLSEESVRRGTASDRVSPAELTAHVEAVLDRVYASDHWVDYIHETGLYLNYGTIARHGLTIEEVTRVSADALQAHPGISLAVTRDRIINGQLPDSPLYRRIANSFYPDRSGDVIPIAEPFYVILDEYSEKPMGSSHGQPHQYDVHVPLILRGPWIRPGLYRTPIDMADLTPTICEILNISMPSGRDGSVLEAALK